MTDLEVTKLPSGELLTVPKEKLTLDFTKSHTRYKNAAGKVVPGVTTILGLINKPQLLGWAWKQGRDGIELEAARNVAADIGTVAHALCEAHLRGLELDHDNIAPDVLRKAETSFLRFLDWWDKEGLTVVHSELPMVSELWQVGGTLDILALRRNGKRVVVDLKSGKAIYGEMFIQVAAYAAMYEETAAVPVDECVIVRIPKEDDDELEVKPVGQRPERVAAFASLCETRRLLQLAGLKV